VCRGIDLLDIVDRQRQRGLGVPFGIFEQARIAVGDRQIALRDRLEVIVVGRIAEVQCLAGCANALAKLALLGQRHGTAAIGITVELDGIALEQRLALDRKHQDVLCIALPRERIGQRAGRRHRFRPGLRPRDGRSEQDRRQHANDQPGMAHCSPRGPGGRNQPPRHPRRLDLNSIAACYEAGPGAHK
jgi:hypothetical protein